MFSLQQPPLSRKNRDIVVPIGNKHVRFAENTHKTAQRTAVLDTGATGHFFPHSYKGQAERATNAGVIVRSATNNSIRSIATDQLTLPHVDTRAKHCDKFKDHELADALISIPQLTRSGCSALFTPRGAIVTSEEGNTVLTGEYNANKAAFVVDLDTQSIIQPSQHKQQGAVMTAPMPNRALRTIEYEVQAVPDLINYLHAAAGFPVKDTWIKAIKKGYYISWPGLTARRVERHLQKSEHTVNGHLHLIPQGIRSTKKLQHQRNNGDKLRSRGHTLHVSTIDNDELHKDPTVLAELKNMIATDLPGRFPITSARGNKYMFVLYDHDTNYIHVEPMKSRKAEEMVRAFSVCYKVLTNAHFRAKEIRLDNEISTQFIDHLAGAQIAYQLVTPSDHRANPAERAIQSFKNHFIAMLSGTDDSFPLDSWDHLIPQCNVTLNLLRESRLQPALSAYAQIHGTFNFDRTPLAPAGCKVIIHDRPKDRPTWANHGTPGYYIGPAMKHYRNYTCYIPETRHTRCSNTVAFFPTCCRLPRTSATDRLTMTLQDLKEIITQPHGPQPYVHLGTEANESVRRLLTYLSSPSVQVPRVKQHKQPQPLVGPVQPNTTYTDAHQEHQQPPRVPQQPPRVPHTPIGRRRSQRVPRSPPPRKIYNVGTIIRKQFPEDRRFYEGEVTSYDDKNKWYKIRYLDGMTEDFDEEEMRKYRKDKQRYAKSQYRTRALLARIHRDSRNNSTYTTRDKTKRHMMKFPSYDTSFKYDLMPTPKNHKAYATGGTVWDPELKKMAHYRDLIVHPNPEIQKRWMESGENEFGRLFQGFKEVNGMDVLEWIHKGDVPQGKNVTYARYTVAFRPEKLEKYRTRITGGGDRLQYDGDVATYTASLETFKLLVNSTISTDGARMCTGDISNMYLYSDLQDNEYVRFRVELIPPGIIKQYQLTDKIANGYIYAKVKKAWYGLKQSGRIAHEDLVKHLAEYGYEKVKFTECLFKHKERNIQFALVVDDFAIKYVDKADAEHLIESMGTKYPFKVDWEAKQFIGINMKWNYTDREVELSMDNYVAQAIKELEHCIPKQHHYGPSKAVEPVYGQKVQYAKLDNSNTISPELETFIQKVTGKFLYYARAVDNTMLHALNDIASAKKNEESLAATKYFLNYAACNPNGSIIYRKSEMILQGDSDAAYLVCPEARSRAGGYIFVGNKDRSLFNGPILVIAKIIKNVMASAAEAEVAALFLNAQEMVPLRQCLIELGHPQPATPLKTDNSTATGIATGSIKQKRSKAIDMRFYWLRDRVKQKQFEVYWEPGKNNLADYVTKHHPGTHHRRLRPIYLYDKEKSPASIQGCIKILGYKDKSTSNAAYQLTKNIVPKYLSASLFDRR